MKSIEIRKQFFDFFIKRGHEKVASSSLVPAQDPTLLFANAGMNQFKDVFLGKEKRSYARAVSIQKCMRAGGKHNDLDNVGFTSRHLTFFEMMGNFSFGDYFKKEAIQFAWEFLTKHTHFKPEKMYASVYEKDNESYDIWHSIIGLPKERIIRLGAADNFWQMGDTGPCGPCTEIYVDRGTKFGCGKSSCAPGCSCDRFLEVWNLVFMQYDRQPDGTDKPLTKQGVDTGMGLERLCMIVEEKNSVFETDIFAAIMTRIEQETGLSYTTIAADKKAAFNVLADHVRAACFVIADGVTPSNEGRGYVLRKIIRRAALFAQKLTEKNIFPAIADAVIEDMQQVYPELQKQRDLITKLLNVEVEKFAHNLVQGQRILEQVIKTTKNKIITGEQAFKLYDTYGFPLEITRIIGQDHGFSVDIEGYEKFMQEQRERSGKKETVATKTILTSSTKTEFTGYNEFQTASKIIALIHNDELVSQLSAGDQGWVIAEKIPFYVERGGQVSDRGWLMLDTKKTEIQDLKRIEQSIAVKITTPIAIKIGDRIEAIVDKQYRLDVMNNHTATHLLQAALILLLGDTVRQSGSLVAPDYLRFDFNYHENLTADQIKHVEALVNEKIRENIPVSTFYTSYKQAIDRGVIAIFGEKYNPEEVRVVDVPGFSAELCGGTHVHATGDIGCFKITEVSALSAGQRRIVALTGRKAVELFQDCFAMVKGLSQDYKVKPEELNMAIEKQKDQYKQAQDTIKQLRTRLMKNQLPQWLAQINTINSMPFLFLQLSDVSIDDMKDIAQELAKNQPGFYFIVSTKPQTAFVGYIAPMFENRINISHLSALLKEQFNLRSGSKKDMIQGGGPSIDVQKLEQAIIRLVE